MTSAERKRRIEEARKEHERLRKDNTREGRLDSLTRLTGQLLDLFEDHLGVQSTGKEGQKK